jgi:hypothetical protein
VFFRLSPSNERYIKGEQPLVASKKTHFFIEWRIAAQLAEALIAFGLIRRLI